jgi:hypothetical protein
MMFRLHIPRFVGYTRTGREESEKSPQAGRMAMVRLVAMTEEDYRQFIAWAVPDYAQEQVKAGAWRPEEAVERGGGEPVRGAVQLDDL